MLTCLNVLSLKREHVDYFTVLGLDGYRRDKGLDGYRWDKGLDGYRRDKGLDGYRRDKDWTGIGGIRIGRV